MIDLNSTIEIVSNGTIDGTQINIDGKNKNDISINKINIWISHEEKSGEDLVLAAIEYANKKDFKKLENRYVEIIKNKTYFLKQNLSLNIKSHNWKIDMLHDSKNAKIKYKGVKIEGCTKASILISVEHPLVIVELKMFVI